MIYFIQAGSDGGPIKIGFSKDPSARLAMFQTSHHETLRLLGTCPGVHEDEQELHRAFRELRLRGEWFKPDPDLLLAASDPREVRLLLDHRYALRRWRDWGVLEDDYSLSTAGAAYLMALENGERENWWTTDLEQIWWGSFNYDSPKRPSHTFPEDVVALCSVHGRTVR